MAAAEPPTPKASAGKQSVPATLKKTPAAGEAAPRKRVKETVVSEPSAAQAGKRKRAHIQAAPSAKRRPPPRAHAQPCARTSAWRCVRAFPPRSTGCVAQAASLPQTLWPLAQRGAGMVGARLRRSARRHAGDDLAALLRDCGGLPRRSTAPTGTGSATRTLSIRASVSIFPDTGGAERPAISPWRAYAASLADSARRRAGTLTRPVLLVPSLGSSRSHVLSPRDPGRPC